MTTKNKPKQEYSLLQRIAIITCLFVSLVAIIILIFVIVTMRQVIDTSVIDFENVTAVNEVSTTTEVERPEYLPEVKLLGVDLPKVDVPQNNVEETASVANTEEHVTEVEEPEYLPEMVYDDQISELETEEPILPVIEKLEENLSQWCLDNENTVKSVSIWKVTDREGNLLIALRSTEEEVLATFRFDGIESNYEQWERCTYLFEEISISDLVDCSFTGYHEVGGRNAENVQAQFAVLFNRVSNPRYPDSFRGVITASGQYSCAKCVTNRWLKSDNFLEKEDLEKCFRQVLLYIAGEWIEEVPSNVGFAATGPQGSGIWKVIEGTYYCYF